MKLFSLYENVYFIYFAYTELSANCIGYIDQITTSFSAQDITMKIYKYSPSLMHVFITKTYAMYVYIYIRTAFHWAIYRIITPHAVLFTTGKHSNALGGNANIYYCLLSHSTNTVNMSKGESNVWRPDVKNIAKYWWKISNSIIVLICKTS